MKLFKRKKEEPKEEDWVYFSPIHRVSKKTGIRQIGEVYRGSYPYEIKVDPADYDGSVDPAEYFESIAWSGYSILSINELKAEAENLLKTMNKKRNEYLSKKKTLKELEEQKRREALVSLENR